MLALWWPLSGLLSCCSGPDLEFVLRFLIRDHITWEQAWRCFHSVAQEYLQRLPIRIELEQCKGWKELQICLLKVQIRVSFSL
jgi:hypothetical protein